MSFVYPLLFSLLSLLNGSDEAELVFAGDAMMHGPQIRAALTDRGKYDFSGYFPTIAPYVISADYAVVNLETNISRAPYSGYPCFNAPSAYLDELKAAGFDLILSANNHTLDRLDSGLRATIDSIDSRGLDHIGTYRNAAHRAESLPLIKNINGIRIGFLNYTYGTNGITPRGDVVVDYIDRELIRKDVTATRGAGAEIVIVCIHWGDEHRLHPNSSQQALGKFLKELDVDIIVGAHPHVVEPAELTVRLDGRPQLLIYSLGNFISNMQTADNRGGMMARIRLTRGDDGRVTITNADYRLTFTEFPSHGRNYTLVWADKSQDPKARIFLKNARQIFQDCNIGISEESGYAH